MSAHVDNRTFRERNPNDADYGTYGLAAVVAGHGIMEYMKTGNTNALGIGLVLGAVTGYAGYQTSQNPDNYNMNLLSSLAVTGLYGKKYVDTKRLPMGAIAAFGAFNVARYTARAVGLVESGRKP